MKTTKMVKYISVFGFILAAMLDLFKTGGEGTTLIFVLITSFLFIAASIKTWMVQKK